MEKAYRLTKEQKNQEESLKTLYSICDAWKKEHWKVLGVTTTGQDREKKQRCARRLAEFLSQQKIDVQFLAEEEIDRDGMQVKDAELTVADIKPVNLYALGLECAKRCDAVILVETCGRSRYRDLEAGLKLLKDYDIDVAGVVL